MEQAEWRLLTPEEKKKQLYRKQKRMLDQFLENGAMTPAQYEKSLGDLTVKMGMEEVRREEGNS